MRSPHPDQTMRSKPRPAAVYSAGCLRRPNTRSGLAAAAAVYLEIGYFGRPNTSSGFHRRGSPDPRPNQLAKPRVSQGWPLTLHGLLVEWNRQVSGVSPSFGNPSDMKCNEINTKRSRLRRSTLLEIGWNRLDWMKKKRGATKRRSSTAAVLFFSFFRVRSIQCKLQQDEGVNSTDTHHSNTTSCTHDYTQQQQPVELYYD